MPRPREFDENAVLDSARDQFWTSGYAGTSMADLTAATGLGKGSLYGAFGDKHALFVRTLEGYCADVVANTHEELTTGGRAIDRLIRHLRATARGGAADPHPRGCMMAKAAAELASHDAAVSTMVEASLARWHDDLASCVALAQKDGDVSDDVDADALAWTLLTAARGFEALRKGGVALDHVEAALEQLITMIPRTTRKT